MPGDPGIDILMVIQYYCCISKSFINKIFATWTITLTNYWLKLPKTNCSIQGVIKLSSIPLFNEIYHL